MSTYPLSGTLPQYAKYLGEFVPSDDTVQYFYRVVAYDRNRVPLTNTTDVELPTAFGPVVLDGNHAISINWSPVIGASFFIVFKGIDTVPPENEQPPSNIWYIATASETEILDVGYPASTRNSFMNPGLSPIFAAGCCGDANSVATNVPPVGMAPPDDGHQGGGFVRMVTAIVFAEDRREDMDQTPWLSDIDADGHSLWNVDRILANTVIVKGCYQINWKPFACEAPGGVISLENIAYINNIPIEQFRGAQTPWHSDIDAADHSLRNLTSIVGNRFYGLSIEAPGHTIYLNTTDPVTRAVGSIQVESPFVDFSGSQVRIIGGYLSVYNAGGNQTWFTVASPGHVGINKPNPIYPLDVIGDINITGEYRINGIPFVRIDQDDSTMISLLNIELPDVEPHDHGMWCDRSDGDRVKYKWKY